MNHVPFFNLPARSADAALSPMTVVQLALPARLTTILRIAGRADGTLADRVAVYDVSRDDELRDAVRQL
jgi:hypothetical protein